ncbi:TetR/AcrR family transcriptional regulator [Pseudonocardia sp. TRM90224]|uniref:TetR/AcrR family transcriptional regulator n=1 Tax=Pseudonocardia sp. TRM90224 TaxID=2812678 RepID=UPI001E527358|nr:TetR/AcrR family transcriptional regulator [Pseudonocardia sp. TRM90224]
MVFELANSEGASALSTRRIGEELGVDPTAYYRHFRNKDDLILALGERMRHLALDRARAAMPADPSWDQVLRSLADAVWDVAMEHPAAHALTFSRTSGGASELEGAELILATLYREGLSRTDTVTLYQTFVVVMLSVSGEFAARASLDDEGRANQSAIWPAVYQSLPRDQYPIAHELAEELGADDEDRVFYMTAVDACIAEIARRIAAAADTTPSAEG